MIARRLLFLPISLMVSTMSAMNIDKKHTARTRIIDNIGFEYPAEVSVPQRTTSQAITDHTA